MLKKNQEFEAIVENVAFPNKGMVKVDGVPVTVKGTIVGQKIKGSIIKKYCTS